MHLTCPGADHQALGDLAVAQSVSNQTGSLAFARGAYVGSCVLRRAKRFNRGTLRWSTNCRSQADLEEGKRAIVALRSAGHGRGAASER
jgi:hypothetical protein